MEIVMKKRTWIFVVATASAVAGLAYAQYPIMDRVAEKVIQKYQTSSCQQLWQEKAQGQGQPKPEMEQRAIKALQSDPQMRQAFFAKISAPIVNKMFECGMIP
jgi:transposase-like protein